MTLVTWLKKILAGLGVIWLILVISVMISLFGLRMYAQGDPQRYDGIIALTLPTIEQLVETLGGLYLADQQHTVTGENLAVLMREDRGEFFAGSQEKEQSLQSFYTALKLRLAELTWDEWRQIFRALESNLALELQLFAHNDQTQRSIETARLDGSIQSFQSNEIFIFPVESNVGINKANRKVTRQLTARVQDQQLGG